ncbi:hypothetical protein FRC06_008927 [Ceratobasidium sp. 370]|nr:hypothetical protein FRC06_008927 [Ceratobasidium sp. 370]
MSAKARQGEAVVKFIIARMLFVRLPTVRRAELEMYSARLTSVNQLAAWWPQLSPSNQTLIGHTAGGSTAELAFSFCEVMAEISEHHGNQLVTDTLSPLVIPVISSWELSGEIASVDDTNAAAETAAKGKKGAHTAYPKFAGQQLTLRFMQLETRSEKPEVDASRSTRKERCTMISNGI